MGLQATDLNISLCYTHKSYRLNLKTSPGVESKIKVKEEMMHLNIKQKQHLSLDALNDPIISYLFLMIWR